MAHIEDSMHVEVRPHDHEAEVEAAHAGHAVLHDITKVDHTPELTFRNIIRATGGKTILNIIAVTCVYTAGILALVVPLSQIAFIEKDLGDAQLASWIATASTAGIAAVLPVSGSLTDIVGRKTALLIGCVFGFAGSMVGGFAKSMKILIIGQVSSRRILPDRYCC